MNKKLMAAAVAGALVAPAAFAQSSTVQIYGTVNAEYGFVSMPDAVAPGANYKNWDGFNSGNSNIGFKGEEKLAGGMSAWFQCETDLRFLGGGTATTGSWCDRNSALGLKGGFGSVFLGRWDSPEKLAIGKTRMLADTGWLGVTHMLFQESNRNVNSINYQSPSFGGLSFALQTTSTNGASNQVVEGKKGRSNSMNVIYEAGPLTAVAGYTKQDDNVASYSVNGSKDTSGTVGVAYQFGPAKVGVTYNQWKAKQGGAGVVENIKRDALNIAGTFALGGPNYVWAGYTKAGDFKGQGGGVDTGGDEWQIGFGHNLSKRTLLAIGYGRVSNDNNGAEYTIGGTPATAGTGMRNGSNSSVVSLQVQHKF